MISVPYNTHSRVNDFKWLILSLFIDVISLDSKYSSDVSGGIPRGISFNLFRLHLTTVPVHEHDGGQYPSPRHPSSASDKHLNSWWGNSLIGISRSFWGAAQRGVAPERLRLRSQSENHARWQLQLNGFDARFLNRSKCYYVSD